MIFLIACSYLHLVGYPVKLPKFAILGWHCQASNQIVRCFTVKKLDNYIRYHFLPPLKLQEISCYFWLWCNIFLANQFAGFFTFDLFEVLILMPGVHRCIVLIMNILIDNLLFSVFFIFTTITYVWVTRFYANSFFCSDWFSLIPENRKVFRLLTGEGVKLYLFLTFW